MRHVVWPLSSSRAIVPARAVYEYVLPPSEIVCCVTASAFGSVAGAFGRGAAASSVTARSTSATLRMGKNPRVPALEIGVKPCQRRYVEIHHVPRWIEPERDVALKRRRQIQVVERVLRREERRREIEVTIRRKDCKPRIVRHRLG